MGLSQGPDPNKEFEMILLVKLTVGTLFLVTMGDSAPAAQTIWINGLGEYMRTGNSDAVSVKTEGGVSASVGGAGPAETNDEAPPSGYEAEEEFGNYGGNMGGNMGRNLGGNMRPNMGGNWGGNMGGNMGSNMGGNWRGNMRGNWGGNTGGYMGGDQNVNYNSNVNDNQNYNNNQNINQNQNLNNNYGNPMG